MTEEAACTIGMTICRNGYPIAELVEPSMPETTAEVNDTSAQNNQGGVKTNCVGWIENGNLKFKINFVGSATQETLRDVIYTRSKDVWSVIMPPSFHGGGHSFYWVGQILKCTPIFDGSGPAQFEIEVTCSGKPINLNTLATGLTTPFITLVDDDANALTLSPAAATATYEYTVEAYSDNTSVAITCTAGVGTSIYINGVLTATGVASAAIPINTGTGAITHIPIMLTENAKTPKVHWIKVIVGNTAHP